MQRSTISMFAQLVQLMGGKIEFQNLVNKYQSDKGATVSYTHLELLMGWLSTRTSRMQDLSSALKAKNCERSLSTAVVNIGSVSYTHLPILFGPLLDVGMFTAVLFGVAILQTFAIFTALRVSTQSSPSAN